MNHAAAPVGSPALNEEAVFAYSEWQKQLSSLRNKYTTATPYPHIVLDNFLNAHCVEKALKEFPSLGSDDWIHYVHVNEKKYGRTDSKYFGPNLKRIVDELNSPRFIAFLTELTGIKGLFADPSLEGGGLHQSPRGGFLNIHADFTIHPHHRNWQRRVNVLVYLNPEWQETYGGHLELWDRQMKHCVHRVLPVLNRAVIFNTDPDSFHGHPEPLKCPEHLTRKSIALYYFTEEKVPPMIRSTEYRPRPGEGLKSVWIYLDKMVLRIYDRLKRRLNLSDDFVSKTLKSLSRLSQWFHPKKKR